MPARILRAQLALVATVIALATGCGTTVQTTNGGPASDSLNLSAPGGGSSADSGLSAPTDGPPSAGNGSGAILGTNTGSGGTSVGGSGAASSQSGGTSPGGSTGGTTPRLSTVAGKLVVHLGVVYLKGLDQAYKAANGGKSATTDSRAAYAAVIKALNATNSQMRIDPSYYAVDASSTQSQADQLQAACAHFTQDSHADVVASYSAGPQAALAACLQQHNVPLVDGSSGAELSTSVLAKVPDLWAPSQLSLEGVGALEASYLIRNHWADARWGNPARCATIKQPRIGVVTFDRPDWRAAYDHATAPTFKQLGHPVYDVEFLAVSGSTAEQLAQASSGAQSAVLKFANDCVDHVAFVGNVALDYLFMDVAQQQGYQPRYGLSSLEAPPVIVQNLPQPNAQLHGALGPGWAPYSDVDLAHLDAAAKRPAAACLAILQRAHVAPTDNNSTILALPACEGPMFITAVIEGWLANGRNGNWLDVVNALRNNYRPAGAYAAEITANQHTGASDYRGFAFDDGCSCFRYVSALQAI